MSQLIMTGDFLYLPTHSHGAAPGWYLVEGTAQGHVSIQEGTPWYIPEEKFTKIAVEAPRSVVDFYREIKKVDLPLTRKGELLNILLEPISKPLTKDQ